MMFVNEIPFVYGYSIVDTFPYDIQPESIIFSVEILFAITISQ